MASTKVWLLRWKSGHGRMHDFIISKELQQYSEALAQSGKFYTSAAQGLFRPVAK